MRRVAADDEAALAMLLERHWPALVQYAFRLLGRWEAAEDAAQHAFVRLWANRVRWADGNAPALLHRVARNAALDVLRSPRLKAPRHDLDTLVEPRQPDDDAALTEIALAARDAVDALPARRREIFLLARESDLSYAEIAEVTGLARQSVANQMSLALRDLRTALAAHLPAGVARPENSRRKEGPDAG
ncbi:MAG: sigma-70 family RNA polymerase sigma factor [Gemmatimonadota bacterium]